MHGRFWKWRMHGGAVTIACKFRRSGRRPDLILAGSMLDLSSFLALTRDITSGVPAAVYFHENQLAYPWQESDRDRQKGRDVHYGFINFITALSADHVFFNSGYNMCSFMRRLPCMLKHFQHDDHSSKGCQSPDTSSNLPGDSGGPPLTSPYLVLLRMGFAKPAGSPLQLVSSYLTFSPLPRQRAWRSVFCGTFPGGTAPGSRYEPSCPAEPGLSSCKVRAGDHLSLYRPFKR